MIFKIVLPIIFVHTEICFENNSQKFLAQSSKYCSFAFQIKFLTIVFAQCDWK